MHKTVAEIIQSDIKVNIFSENEKEKQYEANKSITVVEKKIAVSNREITFKDVVGSEGVADNDVERGADSDGRDSKGGKRRQPTTWVQYNTGYGGYGGGGYDGHGSPLHYDPQSRNYFVKFVFSMVFIMLCITAGFTGVVLATPDIKEMFLENSLLFLIISMAILVPMNYIMFCSECARRPPCNFICLVLAVIGMSLLVATVTCRYRTNIVLIAVVSTVIVVAVCMLLAGTRFDFTSWYLYVVGIAVAFAVVATIVSVTMFAMQVRYKPLHLVLLFVGTILNIIILIMELQMILGGGSIEIGEHDYTLAAYMLYTSIVDIFLKIVQMFGIMDE